MVRIALTRSSDRLIMELNVSPGGFMYPSNVFTDTVVFIVGLCLNAGLFALILRGIG
jgi:hypothetical protein